VDDTSAKETEQAVNPAPAKAASVAGEYKNA
jgi:hypothetical protein